MRDRRPCATAHGCTAMLRALFTAVAPPGGRPAWLIVGAIAFGTRRCHITYGPAQHDYSMLSDSRPVRRQARVPDERLK
ncbi:hypothetical protein DIE19_32120 [Burkholderia sp. Bp9126]|nr:hypothetical protein DIE19_32120 [Burkholderia sp. Bp9126]